MPMRSRPHGRSEAWHVSMQFPEPKSLLASIGYELRAAIRYGLIGQLLCREEFRSKDTLSILAGTVHAIGAGVIITEIQQRSDATFRLFEYGRERAPHTDDGIAVATLRPSALHVLSTQCKSIPNCTYPGERLFLASHLGFVTTWPKCVLSVENVLASDTPDWRKHSNFGRSTSLEFGGRDASNSTVVPVALKDGGGDDCQIGVVSTLGVRSLFLLSQISVPTPC
jgi:hypothetical protein